MSITFKKFENKELNVSLNTYIDGKQNTWFKGKDVASALGYKNTDQAIRNRVKDKYKAVFNAPSNQRGVQKTIFITEPGFYSVIFGSKLESAEIFQD